MRDRFTRPATVSLGGPSFAEKMHGAFFLPARDVLGAKALNKAAVAAKLWFGIISGIPQLLRPPSNVWKVRGGQVLRLPIVMMDVLLS